FSDSLNSGTPPASVPRVKLPPKPQPLVLLTSTRRSCRTFASRILTRLPTPAQPRFFAAAPSYNAVSIVGFNSFLRCLLTPARHLNPAIQSHQPSLNS